jgi:serine carboxypeptidase-like clade 4
VQWSGQKEFTASPSTPYLVDSEEAGTLKSHGPLAFLKVCVLRIVLMSVLDYQFR